MSRLPPSTGSLYCSSHSVESPIYSPPTLSPHPRFPFTLIFPLHPPHSPHVLPLSVTSFSHSYRLPSFVLFFFLRSFFFLLLYIYCVYLLFYTSFVFSVCFPYLFPFFPSSVPLSFAFSFPFTHLTAFPPFLPFFFNLVPPFLTPSLLPSLLFPFFLTSRIYRSLTPRLYFSSSSL